MSVDALVRLKIGIQWTSDVHFSDSGHPFHSKADSDSDESGRLLPVSCGRLGPLFGYVLG